MSYSEVNKIDAKDRGQKRSYSQPRLQVFGEVHRLTQGSSGTKGDGGSMERMA